MSSKASASEIQALRAELDETKKALAELQRTLESFFDDTLSREHYSAWKRAKAGVIETSTDTTVGRNLPARPVRTELLNIGGATI